MIRLSVRGVLGGVCREEEEVPPVRALAVVHVAPQRIHSAPAVARCWQSCTICARRWSASGRSATSCACEMTVLVVVVVVVVPEQRVSHHQWGESRLARMPWWYRRSSAKFRSDEASRKVQQPMSRRQALNLSSSSSPPCPPK